MALQAYRQAVAGDITLLEELNGALKVLTAVGEVEEQTDDLITWIPADLPQGATYPLSASIAAGTPQQQAAINEWLQGVYIYNYHYLMRYVPKYQGRADAAAAVAYLRMMCVLEDVANPDLVPATNFCRYNLCRRAVIPIHRLIITEASWNLAAAAAANQPPTDAEVLDAFAGPVGRAAQGPVAVFEARPTLTAEQRNRLRQQFVDIVCLVAYVFRTRGHHYKDDFLAVYTRIFPGLTYSNGELNPIAAWSEIARDALKCIMPNRLDNYWRNAVAHSFCSPQLSLRLDAPCAGTGSIIAIRRGWDDLVQAFPQMAEKTVAQIAVLEEQEAIIAGGRWYGGINERYYGAERHPVSERGLGTLAAIIMAALEQFCEQAPLAKSLAMKRVAQSAPIVGAVVATILGKVATHDAMVFTYMPDDVRQLALQNRP